MSEESLLLISEAMKTLGINYDFGEWKGEPEYPYFVGEYQEIPPLNEDGMQETSFILTGFARDLDREQSAYLALESAKEKIKAYFNKVGGDTAITTSGVGVAVFYSNSLVIPTGDAELKKIQINLIVKEWSVN